jgi:hypothetical protein
MSNDHHPRLDQILGDDADEFNRTWDETDAADEFELLPPGKYKVLVADGRIARSNQNQTPSYKLTLQVTHPVAYDGRKVFHDLWLTAKALPATKRDLAKLGIVNPKQLDQAPPAGMILEVMISKRTDDNGAQFNRVTTFKVLKNGTPAGMLTPDAAELTEGEPRDTEDSPF